MKDLINIEGEKVYVRIDGKKKEIKGRTKAEKLKNARTYINLMRSPTTKKHPDVKTAIEAFREILQVKTAQVGKKTQHRYQCFVSVLQAYNGTFLNQPIDKLTKNDILGYLDYLQSERKVANYTRNNYLNDFNSFLNEMVERSIIDKNPGKGIRRLQQVEKKNIAFTPKQRDILEKYLKLHDPELFLFTRFIYYTFIRPVELLRIRMSEVDIKQGIILVRSHQAKNKKQMPVTIPRALEEYLPAELKEYPPNFYLFGKGLAPGPEPLDRKRVTERHTRAMKACGVYDGEVTMYSWKHLGNCNAYRAGADIKALQAQNRHHSLEMTDKYLRSLGLNHVSQLRDLAF